MRRIQVFNAHPRYRIARQETIRLVRSVLKGERRAEADINIIFLDDPSILKINTTFLNHFYPTDVLSFLLSEPAENGLAGEVYVGLDRARVQSREYGVSFTLEVRRLVVHGVLHLLGYDDATAPQRRAMTQREDYYLQSI